jgi:hypothetical protein
LSIVDFARSLHGNGDGEEMIPYDSRRDEDREILPHGDEDGNLTYGVEFSINIPTRNMFIPYLKYLAHI